MKIKKDKLKRNTFKHIGWMLMRRTSSVVFPPPDDDFARL